MGERFRLVETGEKLEDHLEEAAGFLGELSTADDLHELITKLCAAGMIECPNDLEVTIFPNAVDDPHVAQITVFSRASPNPQVVAVSTDFGRLSVEEPGVLASTVEIIEQVLLLADGAIGDVRALERRRATPEVARPASCPKCGAKGQLRCEYRYDVLGLGPDGKIVSAGEGELSDIFCLACGQEVNDAM